MCERRKYNRGQNGSPPIQLLNGRSCEWYQDCHQPYQLMAVMIIGEPKDRQTPRQIPLPKRGKTPYRADENGLHGFMWKVPNSYIPRRGGEIKEARPLRGWEG